MKKQLLKMNLPEKQRIGRSSFAAALCLSMIFTFFGVQSNQAQNRKIKKRIVKRSNAIIAKNNRLQNDKLVVSQTSAVIPVTVINSAETDFLSGESSVVVNPKQPTVVRLGLAQNAVSIVEFPASDGIYYIHEGNPKMVSVFQSPTKETDRSITIYPGEGFVAGRNDSGVSSPPSATITLQMRSGLVLVLEFVPVSALSKNAHRCVINYNRDEVISARRTAGLAFNLGEEANRTIQKNTKASSKLVGGNEITDADSNDENNSENVQIARASLQIERGVVSRKADEKSTKQPKSGLELSRLVNKRLADCLKNPQKNLGAWSKANYGLSLATSIVTEVDSEQRILIVAVKNEAAANLRLVPGTPELQIQTVDEQGKALQTERIERVYVETTSFEGLITPGSTSYYAIVYRAPVMGASQRLMVLASHREAFDAPSTITLPTVNETTKD